MYNDLVAAFDVLNMVGGGGRTKYEGERITYNGRF